MKKRVLILAFGLGLIPIGLNAQTTLFSESFETNGEGTRYTSNSGGTCNDFFDRVNAQPICFGVNITGQSGSWYFASEDVHDRDSTLTDAIITFGNTNVSGYSNLQLSLLITTSDAGPLAWEDDDDIFIEYAFDGNIVSDNYTVFGLFKGQATSSVDVSGPLRVDTDNNPATIGPYGATVNANGVMSTFTFSIPATGNTLSIRITNAQDGGSEELAFDLVELKGTIATNDAPVLANIEPSALSYTEGDAATQVTNALTVSDGENDNIISATAQIVFGYEGGADNLSFTPQSGISGNFVGGTLSLTGSATPAQYQSALRSVKYFNTNTTDPSIAARTVRFRVSDGANSNFQDRNINFTQTLNAPVSLPACESFETDGHGTRYYAYEFNDGSSNFWERHNASGGAHPSHSEAIIGATGSYVWVGEDVNEPSNPNPAGIGEMLLQPFSASGLDNFTVEIDVAESNAPPERWDKADSLAVQYRMDGGSWSTIGAFYGDSVTNQLRADANLDGFADAGGTVLTNTLQRFTYNFSASGNALEIRVVHISDGSEEIAFDRICASGISTCSQPDVPTVSASGVCNPVTLSITSGNLNDATNWVWYSNSCGGTQIGTGTSIMVSPTSATTFYVRGEGGCVTPGSCAAITVTPDSVAPNAVCQNVNLYLDGTGSAALNASDVDGGSTDNCGVDSLWVDKTAFFCSDVGTDTVTLSVFDAAGNLSSCSAIITILDTVAPVITCPGNIVVDNDAGVCGAKVCYTMPTSADACGAQVPSGLNMVAQIGNVRYYKSASMMTYANAKSLAASFGGELAKINSAALNTTLYNASNGFVWIAGTDEETEGVWKFDNCETMSYLNFHAGEPNDYGNEDYLELSTTADWYDYGPTASRYALIQVEGAGAIQISGLPRGSVFPIGTTTNTFVTVDASGNTDTCSFTITVNDTTSPTYFTDSICPGDSLFVGGAWQSLPGMYTDTAIAASGCDSLLITTIYFKPDSVCNPDTVETILYIVSDSAWSLSTVVTVATSNSYPWPGAAPYLPHDSTFTLPALVGQPYPWVHLYTVEGSEVIKSGSGVTYYRYEFELTEHQALNARFRMFVDDDMQIFINRHEIALEDGMGPQNWRTANHDILFHDNGTVDNGYNGGDPFDSYTAQNLDNIFVTGANDIILAIRNRTSRPDHGGFSFRMDLDKAGEGVIVKKEGDAFLDEQTLAGINVYPNPASDHLSVLMKNANPEYKYTITVSDLSGKMMELTSASGNQLQATWSLDVSGLAAGVYFIKVDSGSQSVVERFIKR